MCDQYPSADRNRCWCYQINWCCFLWILAVCWSCFFWRSEACPRTDCFWFILSAGWSVKMAAYNIQSLDPPETICTYFKSENNTKMQQKSPNYNQHSATNQILANQQPNKHWFHWSPEILFFLPKVSLMAAPEPPPSWRRRFSLSAWRTMVQWALEGGYGMMSSYLWRAATLM